MDIVVMMAIWKVSIAENCQICHFPLTIYNKTQFMIMDITTDGRDKVLFERNFNKKSWVPQNPIHLHRGH